jgi:proteasome lid subunit RPN8/RPN11
MKRILYLPEVARTQLCGWAENGYPRETCGLMLGSQDSLGVCVQQVIGVRNANTERAHDRYEVSPEDFLAADSMAETSGLEVVGIWHSHPDHPAHPSETDRSNAWAGWSYVIVSVVEGEVSDLRSWRLDAEQFFEEAVRKWPSGALASHRAADP